MSAQWMKSLARASAISLCVTAAFAFAAERADADKSKPPAAGKGKKDGPKTPPGHAATPADGSGGGQTTPTGGKTPPGHTFTPPGHSDATPGHGATPPGQGGTPPGHTFTPPGHARTPGTQDPPGAHGATPVEPDRNHDGPVHTATPVQGTSSSSVVVVGRERRSWLESYGQIPRFDLGVGVGYNNPGGMLGIETEYRTMEFLGFGLHGGIGGWGVRLSPVVHAYPFGASNLGLYAEAAFSLNLGGPASYSINGATREISMGLNPAFDVAVGLRRQWLTYFWTNVKIGYQWQLGGGARYTIADNGGSLAPEYELLVTASRPGAGMLGGFVIGMSCGIAFL